MAGVNKVILVGNLGKDPEIRAMESGTKVATFSLATSESYKNKEGQKVDATEWHNIVAWSGLADLAEKFMKKGSKIYLEGKIRSRNWDDKEGNKRYITEIVAASITLLDKREGPPPPPEPDNLPPVTAAPLPGPDDDLPF